MSRISPARVSYLLDQQVDIAERESDESAEVRESYQRIGLILLETDIRNDSWNRRIQEYVVTPEFLTAARQRVVVPRAEFRIQHERSILARRLEFGLQMATMFSSDRMNREMGILDSEGLSPVPWHSLYLPTLLPLLPAPGEGAGVEASGSVTVVFGVASFRVQYSARVVRLGQAQVEMELNLQPPPHITGEQGFTLSLAASGRQRVLLSESDSTPIASSGETRFVVNGRLEDDGAPPRTAELLRCSTTFKLERVGVTWDHQQINVGAWR